MTSPLSPEAVAQMVADREAGTPGPWAYRPDPYDDWGVVKAGPCVLCQVRDPEAIDEAVLSSHRRNGTDPWEANASRIARLPDLEAAYLTLAAENATLRHNNDIRRDSLEAMQAMRDAINEHLPLPSIESDLMQGPENSVFCEVVATAVIGALSTLRAEMREAAMQYLADAGQAMERIEEARASEAAAMERITDLETLLAASTHSPPLPG